MKLNVKQHVIYDWVISLCAIISIVLIIIDYIDGLVTWQIWLNRLIFVVFVVDYSIRIRIAKDKKKYVKHNFGDLYALIPFHGVFCPFAFFVLNKILLLLNLTKIIAFLVRPFRKVKPILDTNGFKYVLMASLSIIIIGGVFIHFAEGMSITDGIWWAFCNSNNSWLW